MPVKDAYAVPTVMSPPGFQLIAGRHGGRLSLLVVFLEGLIARHEVEALLPALRCDLLGVADGA